MARFSPTGAYAATRTALCLPLEISQEEAEDLARGVELVTERVVDVHPCHPTENLPFVHFALHIYGSVSKPRMRKVLYLIAQSMWTTRPNRAPASR